jgi:hypothetical protein
MKLMKLSYISKRETDDTNPMSVVVGSFNRDRVKDIPFKRG